MCIGMANGGKIPKFIAEKKKQIDDLGRIQIPNEMLKKLGIVDDDVLQLIAIGKVIVIEKCEGEEE